MSWKNVSVDRDEMTMGNARPGFAAGAVRLQG